MVGWHHQLNGHEFEQALGDGEGQGSQAGYRGCVERPTVTVTVEEFTLQSCPTLYDPIDGSPPGSSVHGIFQARVLEWGAIAFSAVTIHGCINTTIIKV